MQSLQASKYLPLLYKRSLIAKHFIPSKPYNMDDHKFWTIAWPTALVLGIASSVVIIFAVYQISLT